MPIELVDPAVVLALLVPLPRSLDQPLLTLDPGGGWLYMRISPVIDQPLPP